MGDIPKKLIEDNVKFLPDKIAFVYGDRRYTFKQYGERTNRLRSALNEMGIEKGDRIAIIGNNSNQLFEVLAAAISSGTIFVPLNVNYKGNELLYLLNDSGAKVLFLEREYYEVISSIRLQAKTVKHLICLDNDCPGTSNYEILLTRNYPSPPAIDIEENDPACIIYTSGTTGFPKGVVHTHKSLLCHMRKLNKILQVRPEQVMLNVMPPFHYGGTFGFIVACHLAGCTSVLLEKFRTAETLETIEREGINGLIMVPSMIIFMLDALKSKKYDLSSLETVFYVGSPMPVERLKEAVEVFPKGVFIQFYALTEGSGVAALTREEHKLETERDRNILGSCGKVRFYPRENIRLVDDEGRQVPVGQPGEITLRGELVMKEYWNKPEETSETIIDGWLHTGDIGKFDDEDYLYIIDRRKDMIIRGGENIYPREIEEVLYQHPAILEACVIGIPDEKRGEEVKAVIVLQNGAKASEADLITYCEERLARHKVPKSIDFIKELPKNPTGKILKRELRDRYWKGINRKI
ncbi:long-chain-fatty-acid--CoA ligase [Chloroflexota bacterium]